MSANQGPLSGLSVVEVGESVGVAYVGRALALLGADVVTVQQPGEGGRLDGVLHVGKRSVVLDLSEGSDRSDLRRIMTGADLVVSGLDTETAGELGLDASGVAAAPLGPCVVSLTAFGTIGPQADRRGGDLVAWAASGSMSWTGTPGREPLQSGDQQAMHSAGMFGLVAAAALLRSRRLHGRAMHADIAAIEAVLNLHPQPLCQATYQGIDAEPTGWRIDGFFGLGLQRTSDGQRVLTGVLPEPHMWERARTLMGDPAWMRDPELADPAVRERRRDEVQRAAAGYFEAHTMDEILDTWWAAGLPIAPLATMAYLSAFDQLQARRYWADVTPRSDDPPTPEPSRHLPGLPFHTSLVDRPLAVARAPRRGEDSTAIRAATAGRRRRPDEPAHSAVTSRAPLHGVRVADFSWVWAGPCCSRILAGLGADVVKVESLSRVDLGRRLPPFFDTPEGARSAFFEEANRGKRAIAVDLKDPRGLETAQRLIASSDVLLENFSPGVMERFGLGVDELARRYPELLVVSVAGLGQDGPRASTRLYGELVEAFSGLLGITGYEDGDLALTAMGYPDAVAGITAAAATLLHLLSPQRGGRVDVSMLEATIALLPGMVATWLEEGRVAEPSGNRSPDMVPHGVYRAADGRHLAVEVPSEDTWRRLRAVVEVPGVESSAGLGARRAHEAEIDGALGAWVAERPASVAEAQLCTAGVPCAIVRSMTELVDDEHLRARRFWDSVEVSGVARPHATLPMLLDGARGAFPRPAPRPGEHTAEVLTELGYTSETIAELAAAEVVRT